MKYTAKATACALSLLLCGGFSTAALSPLTAVSAAALTEQTFVPDATNVKLLGRTAPCDKGLWCAHSGTGAAFTFHGTSGSVTIAGDTTASSAGADTSYTRIGIFVNGKRVVDDQINAAEKTYEFFTSETPQDVEVSVVKLSETASSTIAISGITVTAEDGIHPLADKAHSIEFIGDSITCGYGVDDPVRENHFSTATEDVTKTYAWQTADALDVDCSFVSLSGYGVLSGYTGWELNTAQTVGPYYDKLGFTYGQMGSQTAADVTWDFPAADEPDLIVINLGTNDNSYCQGGADKVTAFTEAYVEFIGQVRDCNPNAAILCTLGIMGQQLCPAVEQAVADYTAATGDENVSYMTFDEQLWGDGYAADWHPNEISHIKAATKLTDHLSTLMDWEIVTPVQKVPGSGDLTWDGEITMEDVITLQKFLLNDGILSESLMHNADLNGDDRINGLDLARMKDMLMIKEQAK